MTDSRKAVSELAKMICDTARRVVEDASFDKTFFGVVTGTSNGKYIVTSAGQEYTIKSSQFFKVENGCGDCCSKQLQYADSS